MNIGLVTVSLFASFTTSQSLMLLTGEVIE